MTVRLTNAFFVHIICLVLDQSRKNNKQPLIYLCVVLFCFFSLYSSKTRSAGLNVSGGPLKQVMVVSVDA